MPSETNNDKTNSNPCEAGLPMAGPARCVSIVAIRDKEDILMLRFEESREGAWSMGIMRILGLCRPKERLVREIAGKDGEPDRIDYVITDRHGRERPAHRERFRFLQANRCPKCGGTVTDVYEYDAELSEEEGCDTWVAELKCEKCHWRPSGTEACVDWCLGTLVYDDEPISH